MISTIKVNDKNVRNDFEYILPGQLLASSPANR